MGKIQCKDKKTRGSLFKAVIASQSQESPDPNSAPILRADKNKHLVVQYLLK